MGIITTTDGQGNVYTTYSPDAGGGGGDKSPTTQAVKNPTDLAAVYGGMFGQYGKNASDMYGHYTDMLKGGVGTMGQMFDSYSRAYRGYGDTIGNIAGNAANAYANDNANRYGSWASGQNAYQNTLGGLGAAALGAYGSAANAAMQSNAMRESAAMKMMSDSLAANQAAMASYGGQQAAAQAALAQAYANAGSGLAAGRGALSNSAATLGGAGANALANLAGSVSSAAANAATGQSQGQAALRAAVSNALSGLGVGQQNALAQNAASANTGIAGLGTAAANAQSGLGGANAALGVGLGNNMATVAGNSMNYTRDMAKLDLARLLGVGQLNVAGQLGSSLGGGFGGGSISINGPQGQLASGSYGGASGISTGQPPVYMQPTPSWYSSPQYGDGGGMSALGGLKNTGYGSLANLAADSRNSTAAGLGQIAGNTAGTMQAILGSGAGSQSAVAAQGAAGGADIQNAYNAAMQQIQDQGQGGRAGVLAALQGGRDAIGSQASGLDADATRTFGGLNATGAGIADKSVLNALTGGYQASMNNMMDMYRTGRSDPLALLNHVFTGTQAIANPYLQAAGGAYDNYTGKFPTPLQQNRLFDPLPYLAALQSGWSPFMSGLDRAFTQQNANVLGTLTSGQTRYDSGLAGLGDNYNAARGDVDKQSALTQMIMQRGGLLPGGNGSASSTLFNPTTPDSIAMQRAMEERQRQIAALYSN